MKTKGLTLQQALKALKENKCIGIKPTKKFLDTAHLDITYYKKDINNHLIISAPSIPMLVGKWDLILNPVPKTEQRILNYWIVIWSDGAKTFYTQKPTRDIYGRAQHVFERHQAYIFTYPE